MSAETPPEGSASYGLVDSFYIDTDGYTDRDREMFTCGVEYQMILDLIALKWVGGRPLHTENSSRVRMLCGKKNVPCKITPLEGYTEWVWLELG